MNNIMNKIMNKILKLLFISMMLCVMGCAQKSVPDSNQIPKVKAAPALSREQADETGGFGNLSFLAKIDITTTQEGVIRKLSFREGDDVKMGEPVIVLENPQIVLAVERAENTYTQALAALNLAKSRMLESEFQAEAQLLSLEKSEAELARAKINWEEEKRKHQNQEVLYEAGGLHDEAIRTSRFALESGWDQIQLLEKELAIRKIGCRDRDLLAAGIEIPSTDDERRAALISLMTASPRAELAAAYAMLESSKKELVSIQMARDELTVHSPASGVVGARYFEEGERVKAGEKIYTLMDTSSLYAIFSVREKDALRLEKGMDAQVFVDGTGATLKGAVDLVYPQADSQSLSFVARVLLDEGNAGLKPGMFMRVVVTLGPPKVIVTVPESSIINKKDKKNDSKNENEGTVFVLNGSVVSERKVSMGALLGEDREIIDGIDAGELVVLQPGIDVKEGVYVSLAE